MGQRYTQLDEALSQAETVLHASLSLLHHLLFKKNNLKNLIWPKYEIGMKIKNTFATTILERKQSNTLLSYARLLTSFFSSVNANHSIITLNAKL